MWSRGDNIPIDIFPLDIILAADCVYYEPAFPLLVQTLSDLVTDAKTEVLFCYKKRRKVGDLHETHPRACADHGRHMNG